MGTNAPIKKPDAVISCILDEISRHAEIQAAVWKAMPYGGVATVRAHWFPGDPKILNIVTRTDEVINDVAQTYADAGIKILCVASPLMKLDLEEGIGLGAPYMDVDAYLAGPCKRTLYTCKIFGAKIVRVFTGYPPIGADRRKWIKKALAYLRRIVAMFAAEGIVVAIETEANLIGRLARDVAELINELNAGGYAVIAFDPANVAVLPTAGEDLVKDAEDHADIIGVVHAKDVQERVGGFVWTDDHVDENGLAGLFVPSGMGCAQVPAVLEILANHRRSRPHPLAIVGLDYLPLDFEGHLGEARNDGGSSGEDGTFDGCEALEDEATTAGWKVRRRDSRAYPRKAAA